jgi:nucleotide-binding universal stress UspA family protein
MKVKSVVATTDGSGEALRAVEWAAREAVRHAAPLRIVSAASLPPRMTGLQVRPERDYVADLVHAELDQALDAAASRAARAAPGLVIVTDPLAGPPAQAVTESGSGALMLVVGSRGAGAFTAMTLGSVSRYAAAHAVCPVVVIRDPNPVPSGQVAVGVGNLEDCPGSLTFAFEEAGLHTASLLAVHSCPAPDAAEAAAQLAELVESWREKYPGVPVSHQVVSGHPARALVGLSVRADLVVMGRHAGHPGPHGPGRVRHAVLSHAHGPVAVVPAAR